MFRAPVFGRKRHTPESWTSNGELQTDFGFAGTDRTKKNYVAFLLFLRVLVLKQDFAAAGQASLQLDKRSMRIDR